VIQHVITCDMCGAQKREANHWFLVREESGELRISGWNFPHTLSPETRHLCGETCVHKLISRDLKRLANVGTQCAADNSHAVPAAEKKIADQTDCVEPNQSPGTNGSPRSFQYAPREPGWMHRLCAGGTKIVTETIPAENEARSFLS
jgi:hypothetical protein